MHPTDLPPRYSSGERRSKVSGEYLAPSLKSITVEAIPLCGTGDLDVYCSASAHWHGIPRSLAVRSSPDIAYLTAFCADDGHPLVNVYNRRSGSTFVMQVHTVLHMDEKIQEYSQCNDLVLLTDPEVEDVPFDSSRLISVQRIRL